ncbi:DUF1932 domain-containing protein [Kineococcus sp. SYSU DK003]|uniref:DUF1932 domain-containing protein n=1 Tax=Kineococcus sp. SYSU DK003 TaxID=3383124 RepID=UPI003D7C47BD
MTTVVVVGLGEAGALYARGLRDAGYSVRGFDPFTRLDEPGVRQEDDLGAALDGAQLVLSLVGASAARAVGEQIVAGARPGTVLADLNTASPALKQQLGRLAAESGVRFADVAVLAPVPRSGVATPLMVSGPGAEAFADLMRDCPAPVEVIPGDPGAAASRKLVRSVFMKGLAAVVLESVTAARAAGCEDWLREQIATELAGDPHALTDRLLEGSHRHAARRVHEVDDAREFLDSIGTPHWTTSAAHEWLSSLVAEPARG